MGVPIPEEYETRPVPLVDLSLFVGTAGLVGPRCSDIARSRTGGLGDADDGPVHPTEQLTPGLRRPRAALSTSPKVLQNDVVELKGLARGSNRIPDHAARRPHCQQTPAPQGREVR